jgi:hypothetical protein
MKQVIVLELESLDTENLAKGGAVEFLLGEQRVRVRYADHNGVVQRQRWPGTYCHSCKRDLRHAKWQGKHAKSCRVLRKAAAAKAVMTLAAKKGRGR